MSGIDQEPAARTDDWEGDSDLTEPAPPRSSPLTRNVIVGLLLVLLAFGTYLAFFAGGDAERDESGEVTAAGTLSAFDLREGDCFDDPAGEDDIEDVTAVPCAQPHDLEVFLTFDLPVDSRQAFPEDETLERLVEDTCLPAFDAFVGTPFEESDLDLYTLEPTADSWATGDREVLCAVWTVDGSKLEGSVAGSGR